MIKIELVQNFMIIVTIFLMTVILLILTIIIPIYKLMLIIMELPQKTHWNTKIKRTTKKTFDRAKKVKTHHRMKIKHLKRLPRKIPSVKGYA